MSWDIPRINLANHLLRDVSHKSICISLTLIQLLVNTMSERLPSCAPFLLREHPSNAIVYGRVRQRKKPQECCAARSCELWSVVFGLDKFHILTSTALHWPSCMSNTSTMDRATVGFNYTDVIMTTMASQISSLTVVYSTVYSDAVQRKYESSASLAYVWEIHRDRWLPRTKGQLRGKCFHWWRHHAPELQANKYGCQSIV